LNAHPFDSRHLTPDSASLNRVRIVDLTGTPPEILGKTGYDLLSVQYLREQMQAHLAELDLSPQQPALGEGEWPVLLSRCLISSNRQVRQAAEDITRQFGHNIGYLLRTLKRGNPAARPEWDAAAWDYWRSVKLVILGGGLTQGALGQHLAEDALSVFLAAGETPPTLRRSPYGSSLPLIGAARYVPIGYYSALVLDFGGSFVKRARAIYQDDELVELVCLEALPAQHLSEGESRQLFNFMAATIAESWRCLSQTDKSLAAAIPVSLASYVDRDGQPYERQGGTYAGMRTLTDNVQRALSQAVSDQVGKTVRVILLHDGTAAASAHDSETDSATLMLGTAIGIGYKPSADALRPIHEPVIITTFGKR
jgi:hypothetical protein